jgi:diaminopimelate decarboxylase
MKANPMPAVVGLMAGLVDGIDVASAGELKVALDAGADPAEISFAGPGKRDPNCAGGGRRRAGERGIDARTARAGAASQSLGLPARVAVRVNPDFELKGSGMKMGGGPKQFGIDVEQVPEVLPGSAAGLAFEGFHLFAGSQNLRAESICEAQQKSYELALRLAEHAPTPVRFLNLGGGFGIPYFPGEQRLDLAPIGANLAAWCARAARDLPQAKHRDRAGPLPGGRGGRLRHPRGRPQGVARPGVPGHRRRAEPPPVGVGQLRPGGAQELPGDHRQPAWVGRAEGGLGRGPAVHAAGPAGRPHGACRVAEVGDLVVVFQSGAYGASASPQAFLGHPRPA